MCVDFNKKVSAERSHGRRRRKKETKNSGDSAFVAHFVKNYRRCRTRIALRNGDDATATMMTAAVA